MRPRTDLKHVALLLALVVPACAQSGLGPVLLIGDEPGAWSNIFGSVGLPVTQATTLAPDALRIQLEAGALVILEGESEFGTQMGIIAGSRKVPTVSVVDEHNPKLPIIWEAPIPVQAFAMPATAHVFAKERWTGIPLAAGIRRGKGAILWLAVRPGPRGFERFPYLLQAMRSLGLEIPFRSNRLWAFLDSSYRTRADVEYIADRWSRAGISAMHVAAWHYNEPDEARDQWLRSVIEACHRRGILVYAWLELPHVSERFWTDHPEWREKTGVLQDAHLDWRKLMNLANRDCFRAVEAETRALLGRFDWDGVNLAELYFESLEGIANPARFTPMNDDVRAEYKALTDVDPLELLKPDARPELVAAFLKYRAEVARRMQAEWIGIIESVRRDRTHLDLVLTHVDDRFDTRMPELIGADSARTLPLLDQHDFTFLIEDPATVWHLGPDRYREIAKRYEPLTPKQEKLAIDINVVERYQDVYPTRQQTGVELFQLVHTSALAFPRVALYFENSILKPDLELLPAAAAAVTRFERTGSKLIVESPRGAAVRWTGPALVDGRPWPVTDGEFVWLPPGAHVIEPGSIVPELRVEKLNADLRSASITGKSIEISYASSARAFAAISRRPEVVEIDGQPVTPEYHGDRMLVLPRGQHILTLR